MDSEETYHYDFTTVSDLEIFIARIEEIIQEWRLPQKPIQKSLEKNDFKTKEWCSSCENLQFADVKCQLIRYYLKYNEDLEEFEEQKHDAEDGSLSQALEDMMSMENDFFPITTSCPSKDSHPIARWYGLRDFVELTFHNVSHLNFYTTSESQVKLLLSALCIATSNANCQVPFFVNWKMPSQCYYLGICQSKGYHTDFEMIHLNRIPLHCQYLTGLLTLFKSKIGGGIIDPVSISVRFTYILKDWTLNIWTQSPPDLDFLEGENIGVSELSKLPFGAVFDPVQGLNLYATWPHLMENTIVDGESYSDLEPMRAPVWTASMNAVKNVSCLLTDYFVEYLSLSTNTSTAYELLGSLVDNSHSKSSDLSSSLSAITESKISAFSKAVIGTGSEKNYRKQSKQVEPAEGPISSDILMLLLYYLFPDADAHLKSPYPEQYSGNASTSTEEDKPGQCLDPRLNGMKSAPYDSLPWRLAVVMAHVIHSLGGLHSATHLWYEFTQELRFRCENNIPVPGKKNLEFGRALRADFDQFTEASRSEDSIILQDVGHLSLEPIYPDPRTCLLNQKLQLLNCCILKKIEREKRAKRAEDDTDSEEEFYDCPSDAEASQEDGREMKSSEKPAGRLARHGELRLLEMDDFLYIPKTQEPIPKTEDQLEEDAEVLLQLGTDAHGSELRARLMSASLLSDMEAFKAANPGCVLADFIRWYSPRDWIEDDGFDEYGQRKGHLSNRMEIPGNTWLEVWEIAKPVPAKWQRRLFNDTKESEKVLDFFEQQNPSGYIQLLLPVMSVCVINKILEESAAADEVVGVEDMIAKLIKRTERLQRSSNVSADRYKDLVNDVVAIETLLVRWKSLKQKFLPTLNEEITDDDRKDVSNFVNSLLSGSETTVPGGARSRLRSVIRYYFAAASQAEQLRPDQTSSLNEQNWIVSSPFPFPSEKEIILRCNTSKGPQRLHAVLMKNDYRLCGAFTKDNTFF